ncbi:hypothetical protein P6144_18710 [Sphingomonas sp. HITSZ_GF]|uniref:hypothetical protein n=1 Tax=Sphingomonas sp. HITSZ_GF TaxID=3037247 RepID=UPI00240E86F6|nr:hypothetical protein [Sphingomonas sp. HITSZ_GF]MDG2535700.1 hypothetical protein [Sphingomonas sp. HITSZ_GF]
MILALLLAGAFQTAPPPALPLSLRTAAERVSRCGLGRARVRYDKDLQFEVLVLSGRSQASDAQLACVDLASGYFHVELHLALRARFYAISIARLTEAMKPQAREWFAARGLLDQVPHYQRGADSDLAFARSLERLCGPEAAGALDTAEDGHSYSREWLARQDSGQANDASTCLFNAALLSGFPLGMLGNEAATP